MAYPYFADGATIVLIDGRPARAVSVADRGLHYGDGLFETLPIIAGEARHWDRHLERLRLGCARLGMACPEETLLRADLDQLRAGVHHGVLKLIVTRGVGGRGYRPPTLRSPPGSSRGIPGGPIRRTCTGAASSCGCAPRVSRATPSWPASST